MPLTFSIYLKASMHHFVKEQFPTNGYISTMCAASVEEEESVEGLHGVIPVGRGSSTMTRPTT